MKKILIFIIFCFSVKNFSQDGFTFDYNISKIKIPVEIINNLVFIKAKVNDVEVTLLVDTGVKETVIFSYEDKPLKLNNLEKVLIKGFGHKDPFEGYKTTNNRIEIKDFVDRNQTIYLVLDEDINFSYMVGIPVNGIIGYEFFKNYPIKIDYAKSVITIYNQEKFNTNNTKTQSIQLQINNGKPYVNANIFQETENNINQALLLLDIGNSDGIWLFNRNNNGVVIPSKKIKDYLGKGLSGVVSGYRARLQKLQLSGFDFQNAIVAYPDSLSLAMLNISEERLGSIGAEIMRRFTVVFDYKNSKMYIKPNIYFKAPFEYDMSGLEVVHDGLEWTSEKYEEKPALANNLFDAQGEKIAGNLKFKFVLKPVYKIGSVRKESAAAIAGVLENDILSSINGKNCSEMNLQQINSILKSGDQKNIKMEIERNNKSIEINFQLKRIL